MLRIVEQTREFVPGVGWVPRRSIHLVHGRRKPVNVYDVRARSLGSCWYTPDPTCNLQVERAGVPSWLVLVDESAPERSTRRERKREGFGISVMMPADQVMWTNAGGVPPVQPDMEIAVTITLAGS